MAKEMMELEFPFGKIVLNQQLTSMLNGEDTEEEENNLNNDKVQKKETPIPEVTMYDSMLLMATEKYYSSRAIASTGDERNKWIKEIIDLRNDVSTLNAMGYSDNEAANILEDLKEFKDTLKSSISINEIVTATGLSKKRAIELISIIAIFKENKNGGDEINFEDIVTSVAGEGERQDGASQQLQKRVAKKGKATKPFNVLDPKNIVDVVPTT